MHEQQASGLGSEGRGFGEGVEHGVKAEGGKVFVICVEGAEGVLCGGVVESVVTSEAQKPRITGVCSEPRAKAKHKQRRDHKDAARIVFEGEGAHRDKAQE